MRDLYSYFGSDVEMARVKEACKKKHASNEDMMANHLLEVSSYTSLYTLLIFTSL